MIEVLKETTPELQPAIYYVNKKSGKLVAFSPASDYNRVDIYEKAKSFSKKFRKFEKLAEVVEVNDFNYRRDG